MREVTRQFLHFSTSTFIYFDNVTVVVNIVIDLSSSNEFSVATPDETAGKESEFSKDVVSLRNISISIRK